MIRHTVAPCLLSILLAAGPALGQPPHQPEAASASRPVGSLSEQQLADLRAGRGMGLALPAELNGYPGPTHVLEHAEALRLSAEQRQRTRALVEAMRAETIPLGERLIRQEVELEHLFASGTVRPASLRQATDAAAATQGSLRAAHLRYHLSMLEVLSPDQVRRYGELRGYGAGRTQGHDGMPHSP